MPGPPTANDRRRIRFVIVENHELVSESLGLLLDRVLTARQLEIVR